MRNGQGERRAQPIAMAGIQQNGANKQAIVGNGVYVYTSIDYSTLAF